VKTISSRRPFAAAAVLAMMLTQLLASHAGVFAGALSAGFLGHGRGHELSLLGDAGHVDVVLHHGDRDDPPGTLGAGVGAHDGDHVVHFAASDSAREGKRRVAAPPVGLPLAAPMTPRESSTLPLQGVAVTAAGRAALLRAVVLRI
jgi:hypothetical protein